MRIRGFSILGQKHDNYLERLGSTGMSKGLYYSPAQSRHQTGDLKCFRYGEGLMTRLMFSFPKKTCPNLILKQQWRAPVWVPFARHRIHDIPASRSVRPSLICVTRFASSSPSFSRNSKESEATQLALDLYIYLAFNERFFSELNWIPIHSHPMTQS